MSFLIGLLTTVFTQRMRPFNSLFLPLVAAQLVLMRHRSHQVDKYVIDGGYHCAGDRVSLRRRDRGLENQSYRASGLTLINAAIIL